VNFMKHLFVVICFCIIFGVCFGAESNLDKGYFEKFGNTRFRARTTGGFIEYEFFPDGKLIGYDYFTDGTDSGPDVADVTFSPKFKVESLRWSMHGKSLWIYRGNRVSKGEISSDEKYVYFHEMAWEKVRHLEFFDKLGEFVGKKIDLGGNIRQFQPKQE
jgi:hypothetical protein